MSVGSTYVDQGVHSSVLDHFPGVLGCRDVCFAVERDVAEGVSVEEGDGPVQQANQTAQDAKQDVADHVAVRGSLGASHGAEMPHEVDDGDDQATEADGAEAVRQSSLERNTRGAAGEVVDAEVPRAIHASNGDVDYVLQNLGHPVHGKRGKGDEAGNGRRAAVRVAAVGVVLGRLPAVVDGHECDGEPGGEDRAEEAAEPGDQVDMSELFGDVDGRPKHQGGERDAGDPGVETKGQEEAEDEEDDAAGPVALVEHVRSSSKGEDDVQDARNPDEGLGKQTGQPDIAIAEHDCHNENDGEQDQSIVAEREGGASIDCSARVGPGVAVNGDAREGGESEEDEEELGQSG